MRIREGDIVLSDEARFQHWDQVRKVRGYEYVGTVVSVFETISGEIRVVVEHNVSKGMLHIFSQDQLEEI